MKIGMRSRLGSAAILLAVALAMAAPASAQRRGYGFSQQEPDRHVGTSMVSEVNVGEGTLVVDDVLYRVDENTSIRHHTGQVATLASIRVPRPARGQLVPTHEVDFIRFEAVEVGGRWTMQSILILEESSQ